MPTYEFTAPNGKSYEVSGPEGSTAEQAFQKLQEQLGAEGGTKPVPMEPSGTVSAGRALNGIPRQVGLYARSAAEGLAETAQIGTEPIRRLITDPILRATGAGSAAGKPLSEEVSGWLDRAGVPKPETAIERAVASGVRLGTGASGLAKGASAAAEILPAAASKVATSLAANPLSQVGAGAGAGMAGQASKEAGGGPWEQLGASVLGGVGGGAAAPLIGRTVDAARGAITKLTPAQIDVQLTQILGRVDRDFSALPAEVQRALRAEAASALRTGREISPEALSRLADFKAVGATPTRGMLTLDPVQITREQNLAKIAANSGSATELHGLPRMMKENNEALIGRLNDVGAGAGVEPLRAGQVLQSRIQGTNRALGAVEQGAWDLAKGMPGYKAGISTKPVHDAFKAVDDEGLIGFLPAEVMGRVEAFMTGKANFTPQEYKNLRSVLSRVADPMNQNGNQRHAAGVMGRALDAAEMRPITNPGGLDLGTTPITEGLASRLRAADGAPGEAISAVDRARRATAAKYRYQESSPLVETALRDARTADPENLAKSFVLGGTLNDARAVAREAGPEGLEVMRQAIANQIKQKALGGATDEVGKVSQSALNRAINAVGEEKLALFFSPEELVRLRATGRVASLMQVQPAGSAVNNSNTAGALIGRGLDFIDHHTRKIPFAKEGIAEPLQSIRLGIGTRQATNLNGGLLARPSATPLGANPLLLPGVALSGGLLSGPTQ